jgi:hypothetical protein
MLMPQHRLITPGVKFAADVRDVTEGGDAGSWLTYPEFFYTQDPSGQLYLTWEIGGKGIWQHQVSEPREVTVDNLIILSFNAYGNSSIQLRNIHNVTPYTA